MQSSGLPMGGTFSSNVANIYVGSLEQCFIIKWMSKVMYYYKCADDVFTVFKGAEDEAKTFSFKLENQYNIGPPHHYYHHRSSN